MRKFALAILAFVCGGTVQAQVVLKDSTDAQAVVDIFHLRTTDPSLNILKVPGLEFTGMNAAKKSLGYDKGIHWFRFDVVNRSQRTDWFLEVGYPLLDHIEFY
jgi:hypothetical protein